MLPRALKTENLYCFGNLMGFSLHITRIISNIIEVHLHSFYIPTIVAFYFFFLTKLYIHIFILFLFIFKKEKKHSCIIILCTSDNHRIIFFCSIKHFCSIKNRTWYYFYVPTYIVLVIYYEAGIYVHTYFFIPCPQNLLIVTSTRLLSHLSPICFDNV